MRNFEKEKLYSSNVNDRIYAAEHCEDPRIMDILVKDSDMDVRLAVARNGDESHRETLLHDRSCKVRAAVAKHGTDRHRDILLSDKSPEVRVAVAQYGNDRQREQLLHDAVEGVRATVASAGTDSQRDQLVKDSSWLVRYSVAVYGNAEQMERLMNDSAVEVRMAIATRGTAEQRNRLLKDKSAAVRRAVAQWGDEQQKRVLADDPKMEVRLAVAGSSSSTDTLRKCLSDPERKVADAAYNQCIQKGHIISVSGRIVNFIEKSVRNTVSMKDYQLIADGLCLDALSYWQKKQLALGGHITADDGKSYSLTLKPDGFRILPCSFCREKEGTAENEK